MTQKPKQRCLKRQYKKVINDPNKANIGTCLTSEGLPQEVGSSFHALFFSKEAIIAALKEFNPYSACPEDDVPKCRCDGEKGYPGSKFFWKVSKFLSKVGKILPVKGKFFFGSKQFSNFSLTNIFQI